MVGPQHVWLWLLVQLIEQRLTHHGVALLCCSGVARSIKSDVDNLMRLISIANILPRGMYLEKAANVGAAGRRASWKSYSDLGAVLLRLHAVSENTGMVLASVHLCWCAEVVVAKQVMLLLFASS